MYFNIPTANNNLKISHKKHLLFYRSLKKIDKLEVALTKFTSVYILKRQSVSVNLLRLVLKAAFNKKDFFKRLKI